MKNYFLLLIAFISLVVALSLTFYLYSADKTINITQEVRKCNRNLNVYVPKTGDLVFLQAISHGVSGLLGHGGNPTHCGIVWVKNGEIRIVENTVFGGKELKDIYFGRTEFTHPIGGVRVVLFSDLLRKNDGFVSVRSLMSGTIDEEKFEHELIHWAQYVKFDYMNLINMGIHMKFGFGMKHISRYLSNLFIKNDLTDNRFDDTLFCSEFIVTFLQRLGHINPESKNHWEYTPIFLTSSMKIIDKLSKDSNNPLIWNKDQAILCPKLLD